MEPEPVLSCMEEELYEDKVQNMPMKKATRKLDKKDQQLKRFPCTVGGCSYTTPYKKDLVRHRRKHTGEKPYCCELCNRQFSRYDKLMAHTKVHEGVRSFQCDFTGCTYSCIDSSSLRRHIARIHCELKPYKCQICPYQAKDSTQMNIHIRFHTGDSPYNCTKCPKAFKTKTDLQRHFRIHTAEKPFQCPECCFQTSLKCNLNVHIKRKHGFPSSTLTFRTITLETESAVDCSTKQVEDQEVQDTPGLPFTFACKFCKFKTATTKSFKLHMIKQHKTQDYDEVLSEFDRPAKKKRQSLLIPVESLLPTFHCEDADGGCTATFVSEKSLHCHMRQHVTLHPPPAPTVEVIISSSQCESESQFLITDGSVQILDATN